MLDAAIAMATPFRFAPRDHALQGQMLVGEDGPDERGAHGRRTMHLTTCSSPCQSPDGSPDYHRWPDTLRLPLVHDQASLRPVRCGPSDDLCAP